MNDPIRPATLADEAAILEIARRADMFTADELETMRDLLAQDLADRTKPLWFLHDEAGRGARSTSRSTA